MPSTPNTASTLTRDTLLTQIGRLIMGTLSIPIFVGVNYSQKRKEHNSTVLSQDLVKRRLETGTQLE